MERFIGPLIAAMVIACLIAFSVYFMGRIDGFEEGYRSGRAELRYDIHAQAVKQGFGSYQLDAYGKPEFQWGLQNRVIDEVIRDNTPYGIPQKASEKWGK